MPFTCIKGTFQPKFGRPDGDSLRFVPDDPDPIFRLRRRGAAPKINKINGSIQLRYEAIDTAETGAAEPFSSDATRSNLDLAGTNGGNTSARGHIYTNQLGPNGRPIAFVFAGDTHHTDGADVFLKPDDIMDSINIQQLHLGHAYPLFYDTLFDDLRARCTDVILAAKNAQRGLWAADKSLEGASWTGDVKTLPPLFPKLWRRIQRYVRDETFFDPAAPLRALTDWMDAEAPERVSILSKQIFTGFDNVIETTDTTVKMTVAPHDLVIISTA